MLLVSSAVSGFSSASSLCLHYCSHNLTQGHDFKSHLHVNQSQRCMSSQTFSECQTQSMSSCGLGISLWLSSWHLKLNLCHPSSSSSPKATLPQLHQRKWWQLSPSYCSGQSPQSTCWWLSFPLRFNASESFHRIIYPQWNHFLPGPWLPPRSGHHHLSPGQCLSHVPVSSCCPCHLQFVLLTPACCCCFC